MANPKKAAKRPVGTDLMCTVGLRHELGHRDRGHGLGGFDTAGTDLIHTVVLRCFRKLGFAGDGVSRNRPNSHGRIETFLGRDDQGFDLRLGTDLIRTVGLRL